MAITEVLEAYTDRCKKAIKQKNDIRDNYDFEADRESTNRAFLNYSIDINCMQDEILGNYLRDRSHPELSLLLAIFTCIAESHDFPDDLPTVRRTNMSKDVLIRSIREKQPESVVSFLERVQEEGVDLGQ